MQLLFIENSSIFKENIKEQLNFHKEIDCFFYSKISEIKEILDLKKFDFIIISSLLPKLSSFDIIEEFFLRKKQRNIIQIVEKKNDMEHKLSKYCFKKPVNINEIISVFFKYQNKRKISERKNINFSNGILYNIRNRQLKFKHNNSYVRLTEKESDIINFLSKGKKYSSKKSILKMVWGFNEKVKTRTLETHIYRLRKKIKKKFGITKFIVANKNSYKLN
tara:strand:+ start:228 stop:887 length:660 start_codon:yes stop_codon:yes gene_type:complete